LQWLEVWVDRSGQHPPFGSFGSLNQFSRLRLTHIITDACVMLPEDAPHVWQLPPAIASLQPRNVNVKRQAKLDLFLHALDQLAGDVETGLCADLSRITFSVLIGRDVVTDVLWSRAAPRVGEIEQRL